VNNNRDKNKPSGAAMFKLILIAGVFVFLVWYLFFPSNNTTHSASTASQKNRYINNHNKNIITDTVSADTEAEALQHVAALYRTMQKEMQALAQTNQALQRENQRIVSQLQQEMQQWHSQNSHQHQITSETETMQNQLQTASTGNNSAPAIYPGQLANTIDDVLESDSNNHNGNEVSSYDFVTTSQQRSLQTHNAAIAIGTVEDLTTLSENHHALITLHDGDRDKSKDNAKANDNLHQNKASIAHYTIPANGTAIDTTLMTALVGRVPYKGKVTEPYPFKLIVGTENLAANGYKLPQISGMVVSGYATGELTTQSARGWITSVTFIFTDGTIHNVTSNQNNNAHFTNENSLGFITDSYGNPFIKGELITNAPKVLGTTIALNAAKGAANAYAQSQVTTQSNNPLGNTSSQVTGNIKDFLLGKAAEDSSQAAMQWWQERIDSSLDVIYIPAGKTVAIHFSKNIPIDYHPAGRKLRHLPKAQQTTPNAWVNQTLD
jgi:integrating conjugative element protein (TIGR03752 family)